MPSRLGVRLACAPRKPMRSGRVEPNVIRIMLGFAAAGESTGKTTKIRMMGKKHGPRRRSMDRSLQRSEIGSQMEEVSQRGTLKKILWAVSLVLSVAGAALLPSCRSARANSSNSRKMIILGIDGMDPDLLTRFMAEGKMPNFAKLAQQGSFRRLTTSIPPQSPVAWSNLITGMNAGGHGIFDFIHRDPKNFQMYFSTSRVEGPKHSWQIGNWVVPLGSGSADQLRHGKAFWEILDERGIPNSVYRIPANFPPIPAKGKTLSGMGTPDLRGTYGTFTFYTDDATAAAGAVEGGEVVQVEVNANRVVSNLIGPGNTFRKDSPPATESFKVDVDPFEPVARVSFQNQQFVLKEGEWSGWVPIEFQLMPVIGNV